MFLDGNSLIGKSSPSAPTTSAGSTLGTTETGFRLSQGEEDEGGVTHLNLQVCKVIKIIYKYVHGNIVKDLKLM